MSGESAETIRKSFTLPKELYDELMAEAEETGASAAALMRMAVSDFLAQRGRAKVSPHVPRGGYRRDTEEEDSEALTA